jgi:pSer/pThr/pTyr-binding forkhead associated (FHA) protein
MDVSFGHLHPISLFPAKVAPLRLLSPAWDVRTDMLDPIAKLIVTESKAACREIPLCEFPQRLGRSPSADICIDDRWVSRYHCEIDYQQDALTVCDLGSKHGTFVNGQPVKRVRLRPGDELSVGLSRFVVELHGDSDVVVVAGRAYAST